MDDFESDDDSPFHYYGVEVTIELADAPLPGHADEVWCVDLSGMPMRRSWLLKEVDEIPLAAGPAKGHGVPHAVDVIDRRTEWGASGASLQVLLYLAASGVVGGAAWEAVKQLASRGARMMIESGCNRYVDRDITEEEARNRCEWLISKRYEIDSTDLRLRSVETASSVATVIFDGPGGWTFTGELTVEHGVVLLTKVRRERN